MRRGFTLVEVLVVIGIIALLISVLMPAMSAARKSAVAVQCLSNLRQLGVAAQVYSIANEGRYPSAKFSISWEWDFRVLTNSVTGEKTLLPGILWMGKGPMKVQQCPAYEGPSTTTTDPYTGYNYNTSFIGHGRNESVETPMKAAQVRRPFAVALFGDGQFLGGTNKYMRAPVQETPVTTGDSMNVNTRAAGTQGYRHKGNTTNVCFADGHAEAVRERFTQTTPAGGIVAAGTGFLSADNRAYDGRP